MKAEYSIEDIAKSYEWLGHRGRGFTELNAFHPDYKPGSENFAWNLKQQAFPRVWYGRTAKDVLDFVERYSGERVVCYGVNPRPKIQKNERGFPKATLDREIEVVQNVFFDFDSEEHHVSDSQKTEFEKLLARADDYFQALGIANPVRGYSGRGYHLLFPLPPVKVGEVPDIADRLREFRHRLGEEMKQDLASSAIKLDSTQDLRRMVRVYGTAKPYVGIVSKFYGDKRKEDPKLRDYLLSLDVPEERRVLPTPSSAVNGLLRPGQELPQWFVRLLDADDETRGLWSGEKKNGGDNSGSGFDYSLARRLLYMGHHDLDELATILSMRPGGSVQSHGKGENYIRRTIANALVK